MMDKWMRMTTAAYVDDAIDSETYRFSYKNLAGEVMNFHRGFIEIVIMNNPIRIPLEKVAKVAISPVSRLQKNGNTIVFDMGDYVYLFAVDTNTGDAPDFETVYNQVRRWVVSGQNE